MDETQIASEGDYSEFAPIHKFLDLIDQENELAGIESSCSDGIRGTVKAFRKNLNRLARLAELPMAVELHTRFIERLGAEKERVRAKAKALGKTDKEIQEAFDEFSFNGVERKMKNELRANSELSIMMYGWGDKEIVDGMDSLFSSLAIGAWTIFETLSEDLWEKSLNAHPKILSTLSGAGRRIQDQSKASKEYEEQQKPEKNRQIPLARIHSATKGSFDLSNRMGSLLKKKQTFDKLSGIRQAYSEAFSDKSDAIDAALSAHALDVLSSVRNVLVHSGGDPLDEEYVEKRKYNQELPHLPISGDWLFQNFSSILSSCKALLIGVDLWLKNN